MSLRSCCLLALLALGAACVVDPLTTHPVNAPEWHAKNVEGYVQTASGAPPDLVYGWDLRVVGDTARWQECSAIDVCSAILRERPASDLLSFKRVGRANVRSANAQSTREVDVLQLSLVPGRKYEVPSKEVVPPTH